MTLSSGGEPRGANILGDTCTLPFRTAAFDCVLSTEVAEHIPDPWALFREISRVLRLGGDVVLSLPLLIGLHEEPRDYFRYTRYALEHVSSQHAIALVRRTAIGGVFGTIGQLLSYHIPEPRRAAPREIVHTVRGSIQWTCALLDRATPRPRDALGYVVVGRRAA